VSPIQIQGDPIRPPPDDGEDESPDHGHAFQHLAQPIAVDEDLD
jgi:hypothetical protein